MLVTVKIVLLALITILQVQNTEEEILQSGIELENNQQYEEALELWETALTKLEQPSLAIGREYIRLATAQKLNPYYQTASNLYYWGLSTTDIASNKKTIAEEMEMLRPLVDGDLYKKWESQLDQNDPALLEEIMLFWQKLDPSPASRHNERLLEHWERIAYAREHFTLNDNTAYQTDDRGITWVQYGKPDRKYDGNLNLVSGQVASFIDRFDPNLAETQKRALENAVVSLHERSRYKVWIYERPNSEMKYNLIQIFGDKPSGGFQQLNTLDDFIPSRAFSFSSRHRDSQIRSSGGDQQKSRMSPGMVLQYFYYKQLAAKDFYFSNVYNRMVTEWSGDTRFGEDPGLNISAGPVIKQQTQMATLQDQIKAPDHVSTYEKEFPEIPIDVYQYRFLNEQGRTMLSTFIESNAQWVFQRDLAFNQDSMFTDASTSVAQTFANYKLQHGVQLNDENGEKLLQHSMPVEFLIDSSGTVTSSSVLTVPFVSGQTEQIFFAKLKNVHPKSSPRIQSPFPDDLRGMGKLQIPQTEPLNSDPNTLEMADIVLGYQMQDREREDVFYPFIVANDLRIPADEELALRFEVYHLKHNPDGIARFRLQYQILPVDGKDWSKDRQEQASLTLNFQTEESFYRENLSIQTVPMEAGSYLLKVNVVDIESGQTVEREIEFEVTET